MHAIATDAPTTFCVLTAVRCQVNLDYPVSPWLSSSTWLGTEPLETSDTGSLND